MKKKLLFIALPLFLLTLSACSLGEIQIQKTENNTIHASDASNSESLLDVPKTAALGETLFAKNLVMNGGSGTINWSIDKNVQVYKTMQDAGLQLEDMLPGEFADGLNWNAEKKTFTDDYVLIMLHITIENIDAVSRAYAEEPEKYDMYDFRVDSLGGCGSLMYSSKMGDCNAHPLAFHLKPGESTEIDAGYLVNVKDTNLEDVTFNTAATPENGTIIDLNLS